MTLAPGERAMKCACGHTAYPRVSPAMMVLVKRAGSILLARAEGERVRTFVFRQNELLVRLADAGLPDEDTTARLGHDPSAELPVGLWGRDYCRAIWLPKTAVAPEGHEFKGLRALWTRVDEDFLANCEWRDNLFRKLDWRLYA